MTHSRTCKYASGCFFCLLRSAFGGREVLGKNPFLVNFDTNYWGITTKSPCKQAKNGIFFENMLKMS